MFVALDTTFGALADVARPFIQETISKSPPTEDTAIETLPTIRPLPRPQRRALRRAAAGHPGAARQRADDSPTPPRSGSRRCAPRRCSTRSSTRRRRRSSTSTTTPARARASTHLTDFNQILAPTLQFITPAQSVCNYATLLARNVASLLRLGDGVGTLAALHRLRHPAGPQQRGRPVIGAGQRRRHGRAQLPPRQPVPEHRLAGPGARVRGGQRALHRRPARDRKRARQPGHRDRGPGHAARRARRTSRWPQRRQQTQPAALPPRNRDALARDRRPDHGR